MMLTQTREEPVTTIETPMHPETVRTTGWIWTLTVMLIIAAFAGGYFAGRATEPDPKGVAPSAIVERIDDLMAASNSGDQQKVAAFFYDDAVLTMMSSLDSETVEGAEAISAVLAGGTVERTSEVVQHDNLYSFAYQHTNSSGIIIQRFNTDGLIVRMWLAI